MSHMGASMTWDPCRFGSPCEKDHGISGSTLGPFPLETYRVRMNLYSCTVSCTQNRMNYGSIVHIGSCRNYVMSGKGCRTTTPPQLRMFVILQDKQFQAGLTSKAGCQNCTGVAEASSVITNAGACPPWPVGRRKVKTTHVVVRTLRSRLLADKMLLRYVWIPLYAGSRAISGDVPFSHFPLIRSHAVLRRDSCRNQACCKELNAEGSCAQETISDLRCAVSR